MGHTKLLNPEQLHVPAHAASAPVQDKRASGAGNRDLLSQLGGSKVMPEPVQAKMEETLGADFSGVHLYESPIVAQGGAQAAAAGNAVAFAPGRLNFSSRAGLELLGHELSHVASQARGEVAGSGFVSDSALEHRADADGARAASAFDSLSGQTLTPMSAGMSMPSAAAPVQAKKDKTPKNRGDVFKEDYAASDLSEQVRMMANWTRYSSADAGSGLEANKLNESDAVMELLASAPPEFADEMLRQQIAAAQDLNVAYMNRIAMGQGDAQAAYLTKYSEATDVYQSYCNMVRILGMNGNPQAFDRLIELTKALPQTDQGANALLKRANDDVLLSHDLSNEWANENPRLAADLKDESTDRNLEFARNWNETRDARTARANRKRGFFSRLFRR